MAALTSNDGARFATVAAAKLPRAEGAAEASGRGEGDEAGDGSGRCVVVEIRQAGLLPLMYEREALGAALETLAISRKKANAALAKRRKHVKAKAKKKSGWW
jgi:ribosome-interacting GTPase 1